MKKNTHTNKKNEGYSRREFLRRFSMGLGTAATFPALASASSWFAEQERKYYYEIWQMMQELPENEKLGIALVGLGNYSTGQLGPALRETKLCKLSGIVTGTPAKEAIWAEEYGIPEQNIYNYETFDQIADNPDINIIYVVLPNSMHAEYTIRAAEAGKHVICEKPMATSVADAMAMLEACRQASRPGTGILAAFTASPLDDRRPRLPNGHRSHRRRAPRAPPRCRSPRSSHGRRSAGCWPA